MAEHLYVIAGVVGILEAATQASTALFDLVKTIDNTPKEIDSISKDISEFESVMSNIYIALQDPDVQRTLSKDLELMRIVSNVKGPVNGCRELAD